MNSHAVVAPRTKRLLHDGQRWLATRVVRDGGSRIVAATTAALIAATIPT